MYIFTELYKLILTCLVKQEVLALLYRVCLKLRQEIYYEIRYEQQNKVRNMVIDWQSGRGLNAGPLEWLPSTITTKPGTLGTCVSGNPLTGHAKPRGSLNGGFPRFAW